MLSISGVITILVCAIISGHYAWYNLTPESRIVVNDTFYLLGDGTQALIFSYLGLTTFSYSGSQISYIFILLMVLAIMLARFITTFGMAGLEKLIKKQKYEFDARTLSVIWFGGIFRGTIAFALVISFDIQHEDILQVTVLGLVIFSMLVFGLLMPIWVSIIKPKEVIEPFLSMIEAFKSGDLRRSLIGTGRVNFLFTKDDVGKNKNWFHSK
jgi:NhaP-type Na+/H+ and K+/H+ antiporters